MPAPQEILKQLQLRDWLATRPESVQKLAVEFPLCTPIKFGGKIYQIFGYTEDDMLIVVSEKYKHTGYENCMEHKEYLCAKHLREAK